MTDPHSRLAARIRRLEPSPIREILHVLERPEMISFAGGLPAEESFSEICVDEIPKSALQYGPTEGDHRLRELIAADLCGRGLPCTFEQILILSGSQQGIDLAAKLCVDVGSRVAVESPTYLAALQVFRLFGAEFVPFDVSRLHDLQTYEQVISMAYTNPTFQNPTGYCYSRERREALATLCDNRGIILFEDDPYRDLAYEACDRTPICSLVRSADWIYQSSFSKTMAPGLRVGYLATSPRFMPYLTRLKQAADLHTNRLSQHLIVGHLSSPNRERHLREIIQVYREKRTMFNGFLMQHFGEIAHWSLPQGGLFFWVSLRDGDVIDTREMMTKAIGQNVAFMPGEPFYADAPNAVGKFRLNFSLASEGEMDRGLRTLSKLFKSALRDSRLH